MNRICPALSAPHLAKAADSFRLRLQQGALSAYCGEIYFVNSDSFQNRLRSFSNLIKV